MNNKWNNAPPVHQSNIVRSNLLCKLKENKILHPAMETTHNPQVIPLHYCQTATNSKAASNDNSNINYIWKNYACQCRHYLTGESPFYQLKCPY